MAANQTDPGAPGSSANPGAIFAEAGMADVWRSGAAARARTLGAAALWSSAISLVTGSAARDVVLNDRIFAHLPLIELDEGPVMLSNVIGVDHAKLAVGLPVAVAFEAVDESLAIPVFTPAG